MIHSMSSATSASRPSLSPRPIAPKKSFTVWTFFSVLIGVLLDEALCRGEADAGSAAGTGAVLLKPSSPESADEVEIHAGQRGADLMHRTTRDEGPEVDGDQA